MTVMKRPVVFPFLLAAFPIARLAAQNAREVAPGELVAPLAMALVASLAMWLLARWAFGDGHRAGLIVAATALLFLMFDGACSGFDTVATYLSSFWVGGRVTTPAWSVLLVETVVLVTVAWLVARRPREPERWTPALNVFAGVLLALPLAEAANTWVRMPPVPPASPSPPLAELPVSSRRPDIYYIILDGFARGDILKQEFGYDIEPFLRRLEAKGFFVARHATANYCQTPLSLSSSLNANYLPKAKDDAEAARPPDKTLFRENAVIRALRPLGYKFVTFGTGFDFTEFPGNDMYESPHRHLSDFHRMIVDATPVRFLWPDPSTRDPFTMARERTLHLFDRLPGVARMRGPKLTVAHVVSPHPPFVFGAEGEDVSPRPKKCVLSDGTVYRYFYGGEETYIPGYRAQVEFLVKQTERAIDQVLANSAEPPIIVLQSDHGPGMRLDMESAERTDHRERMGILAAAYLPGGGREGLTDAISPVNIFRVVFNNEFGTRLPLLPSESYYSTWPRPFDFVRVTEQVRDASPMACDAAPRGAAKGGGL
jgi:hypothetical protein